MSDGAAKSERGLARSENDATNVPCAGGNGNVRKFTRVMTASVPSEPISSLCRS